MIVNSLKDGWEIIYQRSHANLAAMLVAAWRHSDHIHRWTELLIATAQHDDQEMFWDTTHHLTDIGAPIDFTQSEPDTKQNNARVVIANAHRQGVWIALLISMHNSFLYEPMRGEAKELDAFLDQQRDNQAKWRRQLNYTKAEAEHAYAFLRFGDQLSLILCRREIPAGGRALDVMPGPDGEMIRVRQRDEDTLTLEPWVFEENMISFSIEVRRLQQLKFKDDAEFTRALHDADIEIREWRFAK